MRLDIFTPVLLGGGVIPPGGGKKLEKRGFSWRRRRRENFLSAFWEIFGQFVNKNAIKSDFWGDLGRYFSKIFKQYQILG